MRHKRVCYLCMYPTFYAKTTEMAVIKYLEKLQNFDWANVVIVFICNKITSIATISVLLQQQQQQQHQKISVFQITTTLLNLSCKHW